MLLLLFLSTVVEACLDYGEWDCISSLSSSLDSDQRFNFTQAFTKSSPTSFNYAAWLEEKKPQTGLKFWTNSKDPFWQNIFEANGWTLSDFKDPEVIFKLFWRRKPKDFWNSFQPEHDLVNLFPSKEHISDKARNMRAIKTFYHSTGCDYVELHPASYSMRHYGDCLSFLDDVADSKFAQPETLWYLKHPTGGRGEGIRVLPTSMLLTNFKLTETDLETTETRKEACKRTTSSFHNEMIQKEVYPPLLIHGSTFHVRTYMLIVSTDPYVVLFRKGFALRNLHPYSTYAPEETEIRETFNGPTLPLENFVTHTSFQEKHANFSYPEHFWLFDRLEEYFGEETSQKLLTSLKKMATTVTDVLQPQNPKQKGLYFFLSVDCIIKEDLTPRLLEINTIPYLGILPEVWERRQVEDFMIANEILHIMYKYHTTLRYGKGDEVDAKSLVLSEDWDLLRDGHVSPEFRFAEKRECTRSEEKRDEL